MGKVRQKFVQSLHLILGALLLLYSVAAFFSILRGGNFSYSFLFFPGFVEMLLMALGVLMMKHAIQVKQEHRLLDFFIGIVLFFFGVIPIAATLGLSYFLPVVVDLEPSMFVLTIVLFFSSLYFLVDSFTSKLL
tara:strand:- start:622 stop:1023 length:402 start_codon:yes stop_codon:yes gene_type:complete